MFLALATRNEEVVRTLLSTQVYVGCALRCCWNILDERPWYIISCLGYDMVSAAQNKIDKCLHIKALVIFAFVFGKPDALSSFPVYGIFVVTRRGRYQLVSSAC